MTLFRIDDEAALRAAFRPRDLRAWAPPARVAWPLLVRDCVSWADPVGDHVCVVFQDPVSRQPLGISFQRESAAGATGSRLCDWCHAFGSVREIGLLMCERTSRRRIGVWLCRDLACADRAEEVAFRAGRNGKKARAVVVERMWHFAQHGLGIQQVP
ncbi:MAG: FBP domain-containing protein [Deltaproteobacteria bacterium]|nr:FBP domain-containing protein [Deltaproteobacteria bacterium]